MGSVETDFLTKLKRSLPWLSHYPLWRAGTALRSFAEGGATRHLIVVVANHFEPSWRADYSFCDLETQKRRVDSWVKEARAAGRELRDHDGTPFRHTYFYPAEQYHRSLIEMLTHLEAEGLGDIEVHLHHGVHKPDTADRTRQPGPGQFDGRALLWRGQRDGDSGGDRMLRGHDAALRPQGIAGRDDQR